MGVKRESYQPIQKIAETLRSDWFPASSTSSHVSSSHPICQADLRGKLRKKKERKKKTRKEFNSCFLLLGFLFKLHRQTRSCSNFLKNFGNQS
ncbi:hypothetical protein KOW79_018982 [Hemibagrus wyckioides]|uniref:Uncharacterized protein n=1 Tax=Hemibagrus wyckioides TaxID=337641 RepID=A0A9D3SBI0_9TELE|nr:hypothetical protein KOW79_018982 [Hemibagrus wyckioides]